MFTKITVFIAFVAYTTAQHSSYAASNAGSYHQHSAPTYQSVPTNQPAPAYHHGSAYHEESYPDAHPQYNFKYAVEDSHTGDIHSQQEERDGEVVHGEYSLVQPDGITRIVHYTADKNGFNAQVAYDGHAAHPQQVPAKVAVASPVYNH